MSDFTKHNGSSKKPDATTSDTTVKLKVTPDTKAADGIATTGDTTEAGTNSEPATTSSATKPSTNSKPTTTEPITTIVETINKPDDLAGALIGKLLAGTYLVRKEVQRTSARRVFEGTDIRTDSQVAIVILPAPHSMQDKRGSTQNPKQSSAKHSHPKPSNAKQPNGRKRSHDHRNESALLQLERDTGIKIRAYECVEQFSYCIIALESLEEFENPQPRPKHPEAVSRREEVVLVLASVAPSLTIAATIVAFVVGNTDGLKSLYQVQKTEQPVNVSNRPVQEEVSVPLTNDSDLNPTNDFIAFDHSFVDGFSPAARIDMTGINRVVAQSVIVSLNARDINTPAAVFHAQCVAAAAKNVSRSLRTALAQSSANGFTPSWGTPNGASCFVGEAQSTNVYFPSSLTSSLSVSYPSSLKSQSPGGKRRNGEYMAGYSKIQVPIGDTTVDIAGVPVFPLRSNELLTIDDLKESQDADPIDSDYLPPNSILVGDSATPSKYSELVACTVFGAADRDYPACIPRGYIRINSGSQLRDDSLSEQYTDRTTTFYEDWEPGLELPWLGEFRWSERANVFRISKYVDDNKTNGSSTTISPMAFLDLIGESNAPGENLLLERVTARMKQVDASVTLTDVRAALNQGKLPYGRGSIFLYSPGPGGKLQCGPGYPYMSKTVPNDGVNSAVEVSCERPYNISRVLVSERRGVKDAKRSGLYHTERAVFTPATGWRNLLGDITFEYETEAKKDCGTFTQP